ncbi:ATP-binding protein [Cohnella nanjingensis]|uniref:histidine kinase n=1 Tax=Cohnella nanjingensis TaxID=1387779 RepID=A0A7X0RR04_9BACL|nr:ATP-binding protein [Cohnella nanjingensis]MBB6672102.1 PAS domain-containing protein [Cohnella nanjingensis]
MIDQTLIQQMNRQSALRGLDPDRLPVFRERLAGAALAGRLAEYEEVIAVISFFVDRFLASVPGDPIVILISDDQGHVLTFKGNASIIDTVKMLGIVEGVRFDDEIGINALDLCLRYGEPVRLSGEDHYQRVLHRIACCTAPVFDGQSGRILCTLSFMTDVSVEHPHLLALLCTMTDSVERELQLRRQNTQLQILNQVLLDTKYYGVLITDASGTVVEMNGHLQDALDLDDRQAEAWIGSSIFGMEEIGERFRGVILRQEACVGAELSIAVGGAPRHYLLDVVPIYDRASTLVRVVGSLRDITEMKSTEELLRNTEKLVFAGQVAVSIAHEIRNPLTTVKGMLQLAGRETKPLHYGMMMSELERMNLIVSEFMILGKPQAVRFREERCLPILQEVLGIFEIQATMNGIVIRRDFVRDLPIRCDRNQIKQALLNLLKNAMEALPYGGEIEIRLDEVDGCQRIRIADDGEGMTEEVLRRLGEPFHTTRPDGNGLGFMIVRRIVDAHRGRIAIRSEKGSGTAVEIFLPIGSGPADEGDRFA